MHAWNADELGYVVNRTGASVGVDVNHPSA